MSYWLSIAVLCGTMGQRPAGAIVFAVWGPLCADRFPSQRKLVTRPNARSCLRECMLAGQSRVRGLRTDLYFVSIDLASNGTGCVEKDLSRSLARFAGSVPCTFKKTTTQRGSERL
jgi:hypothetical protein